MRRPDLATLVSGVAVVLFGAVLLLDEVEALRLDFGSLAPVVLAVVGTILFVCGMARRDGA